MKNKKYFITGGLVLAIFSIIFIIKGIFPFGDGSVIWSDMHEQITAIYYHFYDAVWKDGSIFVDFTSGGGVNFFGIMAYYIMSPFSLLLLVFPRSLVENAVSIVVVLKFVLASLTCLYFISKYFKKVKTPYQILLSLLYAFSGYTLILYTITSWMDIVYLFPLLLIGLKKLLDLEDSKTYIIVLTLCLVFCFYISFMLLLFIIFASFIYLYVYRKDNMKRAIFNLGVSTVIAMLISSGVLVPTFMQIFTSQRAGFDLDVVLNSGFGPLSDKIAFLFASGILIGLVLLLLFNFKKHKKFISFLFPLMIIMGLPIIVEPINKLWHFGSYVYLPYRYGFILIFLLIIGACYYLNNVNSEISLPSKIKNTLPIVSVIVSICTMLFIFIKFKVSILEVVDSLTLTNNKKVLLSLFLVFLIILISSFILAIHNKNKKSTIVMFYVLAISNILFNCYFYVGGYDPEGILDLQYDQMLKLNKIKGFTGSYYLKSVNRDLISNYGMVTGVNTLSNFTSLTDKTNFLTLQRLGYDSYWMDTQSIGGNLFTDVVLAQKYILASGEYDDDYYEFMNSELGLNYYEFKDSMPYGYILESNNSIADSKNSFEASNIVYSSITGNESIFEIKDLFSSVDYNLVDYEEGVSVEETFKVVGKKRLYLDIFSDFDNDVKRDSYKSFDVYVNDKLVYKEVPNASRNGSLLLGTYENCEVNIKVISLKDTVVRNITLGSLDLSKLDSFINNNQTNTKVVFDNNVINISAEGNEGDLLFVPITYLDGYTSNYEIVRVFDNFVGIKLHDGINNIEIVYIPKGIIIGMILTLIGIILFSVWNKFLCNVDLMILNNIVYYIYLFVYVILVLVFYVFMLWAFIKSFLF